MGMHLNLLAGKKASFDREPIEKKRPLFAHLIIGPKKYFMYEGKVSHTSGEVTPVRVFKKTNGKWLSGLPEEIGDPEILSEFKIAVDRKGF